MRVVVTAMLFPLSMGQAQPGGQDAGHPTLIVSAEVGFRSGQWEVTRQVTGGPRRQGPQTDLYCFTEAQLREDPAAPLKTEPKPPDGRKRLECAMGSASLVGGKAMLSATCKGPLGSLKIAWSGTYTPTSFAMTGKMRMGFLSATMSAAGRRIGACPAR